MEGLRVQMRVIEIDGQDVEQFRVARENGWAGGWQSTLYLAWIDYRRRAKVG